MIVILKIILAILAVAAGYVTWTVFQDFQQTRKQEGYDELSIWRRLRFNATFFFMFAGIVSLIVFLAYFIITKITLG